MNFGTKSTHNARPVAALFCVAAAMLSGPVGAADDAPREIPLFSLESKGARPFDSSVDLPSLWTAQKDAAPATAAARAGGDVPWGAQQSYIIPALEIVGFDLLLNLFDRAYFGCCDFDSNIPSIKRNLRRSWVVDSDGFTVNQLGHPYQGSMYHGFARASGLNFWESMGYTFAGSVFWEIAGETTPSSKNDQIMTGIGGSFLGEPLFRMANLLLEKGGSLPRPWRELAAAAISPPVGFNRLAFDQRFRGIFSSNSPAYYSRLQIGGSTSTQDIRGTSTEVKASEALIDFSIDYGLPGEPGYTYRRPFDYFNFQAIASSAIGLESVHSRGLLFGTDYEWGANYRGIWGLYGNYDYLAPQLFRVSSTALSLGTTAQWGLRKDLELQGTALLGAGYTAVGTINDASNERDNRYGVSPQALLALRLIFGDRAAIDLTGREYFVSRLASGAAKGKDNIARADASLTVRIHKQHAVAIKYLITRRDSDSDVFGDRTQQRATVGIFYTLLGRDRFGAVSWQQ